MATTWEDADSAPGPVFWNDPVFKFVVTNTGNVTLTGISLQDSDIVTLYTDQTFLEICFKEVTLEPAKFLNVTGSWIGLWTA